MGIADYKPTPDQLQGIQEHERDFNERILKINEKYRQKALKSISEKDKQIKEQQEKLKKWLE